MKTCTDRMLTTHVSGIPCPEKVRAALPALA